MLKALIYSVRYMIIILLFYYIFNLKMIYELGIVMLAIIPVNFLAIHYGILYKIKKDNYVTKYHILMTLISLTTVFNILFLYLNKVNIFVIIITVTINMIELIYIDLPSKKKQKK